MYRATHPILFEAMMSDLFDALREMDLDEFGTYIDTQLTDESYHKRYEIIRYGGEQSLYDIFIS